MRIYFNFLILQAVYLYFIKIKQNASETFIDFLPKDIKEVYLKTKLEIEKNIKNKLGKKLKKYLNY